MNKPSFIIKRHLEQYISIFSILRFAFICGLLFVLWTTGALKFYNSKFTYVLLAYTVYSMFGIPVNLFIKPSHYILYHLSTAINMGFICLMIAYSGGSGSPFFVILALPIILYSIEFGLKKSVFLCNITSLAYIAVIFCVERTMPQDVLLKLLFFFTTSVFSGFMCEQKQEQIYALAIQDQLTSLFNRQYFFDHLLDMLKRAKKTHQPISLAILDLDNFKLYNDLFGHLQGDQILQKVSEIIRENIRTTDIASRYGGDEFTIIFPDTTYEIAIKICERIRKSIAEKLNPDKESPPSISVGVASFPDDGTTPEELFTAADHALYQAKNSGKNATVSQQQFQLHILK